MLCLFTSGLIVCRRGTACAKPLQSTGTQVLTLSAYGAETKSYNPWSLANVSSLSLNVSSPDNSNIQCERYKYGFIDDEVLVDCGSATPYIRGSDDVTFVEDREVQGNVVGLPYRQYGSEYIVLFGIPFLTYGCKATLAKTEHSQGTMLFPNGPHGG